MSSNSMYPKLEFCSVYVMFPESADTVTYTNSSVT